MALIESTEERLQKAKVSSVEKKLLLAKIGQMNNLPTPSGNIMKVMLMLRDEDVRIGQLVPAIEKDQSLVAQILKLINSGFYGLKKTVETVEHAVTLLGILNIKHVVYSASIMEFFSDEEQLEWNHSYSTSVLMGNLIKENELPGINSLPLSMLMHDLGKVVLRRFTPKKYQVCLQHAANEKVPIYRFENAMLQINHAEVGGMLLQKWDTAEEIVMPVLQHHTEEVPENYAFETALVQFVNWVDCEVRGIRCFPPSHEIMEAGGIQEIDKDYWVNYQAKLIESIENGRPLDPQMKTSGKIQRKPGDTQAGMVETDTKSLEKRAMKGAPKKPEDSSPTRNTEPSIARPEAEKRQEQPKAKEPEPEIHVEPPPLSAKELEIISRKAKQQASAPTTQASAPIAGAFVEEQPAEQPKQERPTQVIQRKALSEQQQQSQPAGSEQPKPMDRPTQVIQRKAMVPQSQPDQGQPSAPQRKPGAPVPIQQPAAPAAAQPEEQPKPSAETPQEQAQNPSLSDTQINKNNEEEKKGFMGWVKNRFGS